MFCKLLQSHNKFIQDYIFHFGCCDGDYNCQDYQIDQLKLSTKLGIPLENLVESENDWGNQVILLINEALARHDTHRYSDEVVQCFVEAANADSFQEAASDCQYAMHKIGVDDANVGNEL